MDNDIEKLKAIKGGRGFYFLEPEVSTRPSPALSLTVARAFLLEHPLCVFCVEGGETGDAN